MPPKVEAWSAEAEILLIDAVHSHPMLWDCTIADYRRNDLKERQWEEIAVLLGSPFTVEQVKKRFANMKGTFQDNERRVKDSKRSGCGSDNVFRPRWHLYHKLLFLRKTCASASSDSNMTAETEDTNLFQPPSPPTDFEQLTSISTAESLPTFQIIQDSINQGTSSVDSLNTSLPLASPVMQCSVSASRPASAPPSCVPKKRASDDSEMFVKRGSKNNNVGSALEAAVNAIKDIAATPITVPTVPEKPKQQDSVDIFLNYLGSKKREMNEVTRRECEQEIMTYIFSKM